MYKRQGKYSKFSDTGSAKPGDKFVKQTPTQNVGNTQNVGVQHSRWKTGRFSQANGTPSRPLSPDRLSGGAGQYPLPVSLLPQRTRYLEVRLDFLDMITWQVSAGSCAVRAEWSSIPEFNKD